MHKYNFPLLLVIAIILFSTTAFAFLSENWQSGIIDTTKWVKFGSPLPKIVSVGHNSSYSFDPNSDTSWFSGIYSVETFKLSDGFSMEFWLKGVSTSNTTHMRIHGGISDNVIQPQGHTNLIAGVILDCPNMPTASYLYQVGADYYREAYVDDNWHKIKMVVKPDGTVAFYRDDVLKWTSTAKINFATYNIQRVQFFGNYTGMYVDDIVVSKDAAPILFLDNSNVSVYEVSYSLRDTNQQLRDLIFHATVKQGVNKLLDLTLDITRGFFGKINSIITGYLFLLNMRDILADPISLIPVGKGVSAPYNDGPDRTVKLCDNGRVSAIVIIDFIATSGMNWDNTRWSDLTLSVWQWYNLGTDWDKKTLLTASEMASLSPKKSYIIIPKFTLDTTQVRRPGTDAQIEARATWRSGSGAYNHYGDDYDLKFDPSACGGANAGVFYILTVDD